MSSRELSDQFYASIEIIPDAGCWIWMAGTTTGYGNFKQEYAHRYSYRMHVGDIPKGFHVLHKCDVRLCVNPNHLFIGTNLDNIIDRCNKGRSSSGHELSGSNIYYKKFGSRECKICAMHMQRIRRLSNV